MQYDTLEFYVGPRGILPTYGHDTDAGRDLYCSETTTIPPHGFLDIATDVRANIPAGTWGLLTGRSSTLRNHGLMVVQGVIDQDYVGELFIGVQNMRDTDVLVERGTRLAQLITVPLVGPLVPVSVPLESLGQTARGDRGFGSTGI